jgi:hypothetical protein
MFAGSDPGQVEAEVCPARIQCQGWKWAKVQFPWPLQVAPGCGVEHSDGVSYLIGVSHARQWFVVGGQAVEPVRRGFTAYGGEMNIMPWETPAAALRRQTRQVR